VHLISIINFVLLPLQCTQEHHDDFEAWMDLLSKLPKLRILELEDTWNRRLDLGYYDPKGLFNTFREQCPSLRIIRFFSTLSSWTDWEWRISDDAHGVWVTQRGGGIYDAREDSGSFWDISVAELATSWS
jgi:hypothetical protein